MTGRAPKFGEWQPMTPEQLAEIEARPKQEPLIPKGTPSALRSETCHACEIMLFPTLFAGPDSPREAAAKAVERGFIMLSDVAGLVKLCRDCAAKRKPS